jgi:hypothetical protein
MAASLAKGCDRVPPVELRDWILSDLNGVAARFDAAVVAHVPVARWRDQPGGGSSIAALVFHTAWHADLALTTAVLGEPPRLDTWRDAIGVAARPPYAGLGETEDPTLTALLDLEALTAYAAEVHAATVAWVESADLDAFDVVPPSNQRMTQAGIAEPEVPWLHGMWRGQPTSFFVRWEAVGHRVNHVGEMISVRSRLGLSPF